MEYRSFQTSLPGLLLACALCLIPGCGRSKPDSNANLASLTLSQGVLQGTPASTPMTVTLYASEATITLTPVTASATASVTVNGLPTASARPRPVNRSQG